MSDEVFGGAVDPVDMTTEEAVERLFQEFPVNAEDIHGTDVSVLMATGVLNGVLSTVSLAEAARMFCRLWATQACELQRLRQAAAEAFQACVDWRDRHNGLSALYAKAQQQMAADRTELAAAEKDDRDDHLLIESLRLRISELEAQVKAKAKAEPGADGSARMGWYWDGDKTVLVRGRMIEFRDGSVLEIAALPCSYKWIDDSSFPHLPLQRPDGESGLTKWTWTPEAAAAGDLVDVAEAEADAAVDF